MTEKEVGKIIRSLTSNKAPGPAKVSAKGLADSLPITIAEITNIVITSFSLSKFAQVWKLVEVMPIHKSGDPDEPSNTRPISLLPLCLRFAKGQHTHSFFLFLAQNEKIQNCKVVIGDSTRPKLLYFISQMKNLRTWTTKTYQ